jgi:hypothetical protein
MMTSSIQLQSCEAATFSFTHINGFTATIDKKSETNCRVALHVTLRLITTVGVLACASAQAKLEVRHRLKQCFARFASQKRWSRSASSIDSLSSSDQKMLTVAKRCGDMQNARSPPPIPVERIVS